MPSAFYFQSAPDPHAVRMTDMDAFRGTPMGLGILQILENTGLFDEVAFARNPSATGLTTDDVRSALVVPLPVAQRDDGSQTMVVRTCPYLLRLETILSDPDLAYDDLDRMEAVVVAAMLDDSARSYGGFCLPWRSRIGRYEHQATTAPTRRRVLQGEFSYQVNLRIPPPADQTPAEE